MLRGIGDLLRAWNLFRGKVLLVAAVEEAGLFGLWKVPVYLIGSSSELCGDFDTTCADCCHISHANTKS